MIKNILVGYGGSRGAQVALSQAVEIARASQARIHLTLVETLAGGQEAQLVDSPSPESFVVSAACEQQPGEESEAGAGPSPLLEEAAALLREEGITYTLAHYFGDPAARLLQLSRVADLVVVGRRGDERRLRQGVLGRTAHRLAVQAITPTLFTDREHLPLTSATLLYEPRPAGGRALVAAGEICSLLNITLNVVATSHGRIDAGAAQAEARFALRAYHLEGELVIGGDFATEALQNAAMVWGDPLLVVPGPPRRLVFADYSTLRAAVSAPNANVLLVP